MNTTAWKRVDSHSFELKLVTPRWSVHISSYDDTRPPRANISLFLVRQEDEYNTVGVVCDRPIISWCQVAFYDEDDLRRHAEKLVSEFIRTLVAGWPGPLVAGPHA